VLPIPEGLNEDAINAWDKKFAELGPLRTHLVLPTEDVKNWEIALLNGAGEIKTETQAFVYFDADKPIEIEPILLTGDEVMLHDAIRALAAGGLLSSADCFKYRDVIERKPPKSVMARFRAWRARNEG